ncbi:peptide ABC transporter, partial [Candidatus Magnetomorum sp. HK-1]
MQQENNTNKSSKSKNKNPQNGISYLWNNGFVEIKLLIFKAFLVVLLGVIIAFITYTAAFIPEGQSKARLFIIFVIILFLYLLASNNYYKNLINTVEKIIANLRLLVMNQVRQAELLSFEKIGSDKIYTALTFDIKSVSDVSHSIAFGIIAIFVIINTMAYIAFLSWQAFLIIFCILFIAGVLYIKNQQQIKKMVFIVREYEKKMFEALMQLLYGFKDLKLNDKKNDDFFFNGLKQYSSKLHQLKFLCSKQFINNYSSSYCSWNVLIIVVVLILPILSLISLNKLVTIVGIVLFMPFVFLIEQIPKITIASISLQRLLDLEYELSQLNRDTQKTIHLDNDFIFKKIKYKDITFVYTEENEHEFKIGPLSISFMAGETVFITGGNGSGKSTLLKLMTGLYLIHSGRIYINDKEIDIQRYRFLFSAIFRDYHLFDRFYGSAEINDQKVNDLIKLMQLEHKVKFANNRFSSNNLSTGQRKRLALIMSIVENKPKNDQGLI